MVSDQDSLLLHVVCVSCVSLFVSMLNNFLSDLLVESVCNVEHILSVALSSFGIFVRKVELHAFKRKEVVIELFDGQFFIASDVHKLNFSHLEEPLLSTEHLLGKVFGEHLV